MTRRKTFDRYSLASANQHPGRRRLIKIARTRFGGIAAAAVGRFSTIRPAVSLSLVLSLYPSSRPFVPLYPAPNRPARRPRPPLLPSPQGPSPFRTTQTRGAIRRGLRARHSDDRIRTTRGMSNNIRAATVTGDEAAARNSAARFAFSLFFLPRSSSLRRRASPPRRVIAVCAPSPASFSLRSLFQLIHVSIVYQTRFDQTTAIASSRFH